MFALYQLGMVPGIRDLKGVGKVWMFLLLLLVRLLAISLFFVEFLHSLIAQPVVVNMVLRVQLYFLNESEQFVSSEHFVFVDR